MGDAAIGEASAVHLRIRLEHGGPERGAGAAGAPAQAARLAALGHRVGAHARAVRRRSPSGFRNLFKLGAKAGKPERTIALA
jgi:hypothetical protein